MSNVIIKRMTPAMIINCKVLLKISLVVVFLTKFTIYPVMQYVSMYSFLLLFIDQWYHYQVIELEMPVPIYRGVLPVYPSWPGSLSSYRCQRGIESLTRCWYLPGSQPSTSSRYGLVLVPAGDSRWSVWFVFLFVI